MTERKLLLSADPDVRRVQILQMRQEIEAAWNEPNVVPLDAHGAFYYRTSDTNEFLGILERVTGLSFEEIFQRLT